MGNLAIDIGGTKIALARVAGDRVEGRRQVATPRGGRGEDIVAAIVAAAGDIPAQGAVGVATTGIVDGGRLTALNPVTLPIEDGFALVDALERGLGRAVIAINDAQAAAWAEHRHGAGQGHSSMAFVTVSTGVGGGIVLDGRLQTGARGLAGHVGHMAHDPNGPVCGCGRRGCIERIASGTAIASLGSEALGRAMTAPEVFAAAEGGDADASAVIEGAATALASMFADLAAAVDVDAIVVGGGVGLAEGFLARIVAAQSSIPAIFRRPLLRARLGADAGLVGAGLLAAENNLHPSTSAENV